MVDKRQDLIRHQVKQLLVEAGWNRDDILEEQSVSQDGRVFRIDAILLHSLYPLAVIELQRPIASLDRAVEQALRYAELVEVPFAFATDGHTVAGINVLECGAEVYQRFPAPSELWLTIGREWDENDPRLFPPFRDPETIPQIHHAQAVSRAVEAVVNGRKRVLIAMAAGTGRTYVAFQTAWKLIRSNYCHRMLYLDYSRAQVHFAARAFGPFEHNLLILKGSLDTRLANIDRSRRVHLGTAACFVHSRDSPVFQELPADLYDLILIHNAEPIRSLMPILEHFKNATIVGFTGRGIPGSQVTKFYGQPVFTFSLEDALATEETAKAPEGFRAVRLGDIAEIRWGVTSGRKLTAEGAEASGLPVVRVRDLLSDGMLNLGEMARVDSNGTRIVTEEGDLDARYLLRADDILLASFSPGTSIGVGIVPQSLPTPVTFSNSLIRVRVDPELADPEDVFTFLRSDSGQLAIRRFATTSSAAFSRITIQALSQIPVFLPESRRPREASLEKLGVVSLTRQRLKGEILPLLEELEQMNACDTEVHAQRLEIVARKLQRLAVTLAPPTLAERLIRDYPMPIALAYRRFHDARFNVYEQVLRLRDVFEAVAFYVYNLVLADVLRRLDPSEYYVVNKGARRAYNGCSMKARMDFVTDVLAIAQEDQGKDLFIPELVGSSVSMRAKELQEDFRNRLSHTATATETQQCRVLADFEPVVEEMLSELDFLNRYQLVRVKSYFYEREGLVRQVEVYHGVVPEPDEQVLPGDTGLTRADRDHLVLLDAEGQVLDLYPLYQLVASEETRHEKHLCFLKQRKASEQLLKGESVQGAFPVNLPGFQEFESLQSRILSTLPEG